MSDEGFTTDATTRTLRIQVPTAKSPRRGYLVVLRGQAVGHAYAVRGEIILGRSQHASIRIQDDSVSRRHARVVRESDDSYYVQDLESHNGTLLNGDKINRASLKHGDRIQLGREAVYKFVIVDELEQGMQEAQRLESVGRLAGGIAHDFNNLLAVIRGGVTVLQQKLETIDPETKRILQQIYDSTERAALVTTQLLSFARRGAVNPRAIDIANLLERMAHFARNSFGPSIQVEASAESSLYVLADSQQMEQMLINLCMNARDAMPEAGRLRLTAVANEFDEQEAGLHGVREGPYVQLIVQDDGIGMDETTRLNVFEPYFTTKGLKHGTGLGLSMVYGIVKEHDGDIEVHSAPGRGTIFRIYLPALPREAVAGIEQEARDDEVLARRRKTDPGAPGLILLVDDEPAVLEVTSQLVEGLGHEVLLAPDGTEAVRILQERADDIDAVILDLVMPGLSGEETFEKLRAVRPDLPVLLCSGYDADQAKPLLDAGASGFLRKPFSLKEMKNSLNKALGR